MAKKKRNLRPRKPDNDPIGVTGDDDDGVEDFAPPPKKTVKKTAATKKTTKKTAAKKAPTTRRTPPEEVDTEDFDQPVIGRRRNRERRVHSYDDAALKASGKKKRRLTKKAQSKLEAWKGANRSKQRDIYFRAQADVAKTKFGHHSVYAGNEANALVIGIPMPSIGLEWLIQQDVLPLSVVIVLVGKWRTCKSALLYEIFRWFAKFDGGAILMENETKFSPDLCSSIMGFKMNECPVIVNRCTSMDDWQDRLTYYVKEQKSRLEGTADNPGPGRTIPVCFAVDSVMGKAAEEKKKKVQTEGHGGRGFPVEALSLSDYMRATSDSYDNWPFSLVLVNHLKKDITEEGGDEDRKPGGDFQSFQESFELQTSMWRKKIETESFDGLGIRITCAKNSFGVTDRKIRTRMLWWDEWDEEAEEYQQRTVWDWDWTTVNTLSELPAKWQRRLKEEQDFTISVKSPKADVECLANCPAVGMGKEDWLTFSEVGAMIRKNPEVMERLRTGLAIKRRALMAGDYLEQLDELREHLV